VRLDSVRPELRWAIEAAQDKQAENVTVLKLGGLGAFAEYFLLCSGASDPQIQAISDAIAEKLDRHGVPHGHREGKHGAEWVLLDYGGFVVHVFSERARLYYDLERLWRAAERLDVLPPGARATDESQESDSGLAGGRKTGTDRP
jgi:ribosome-associated protein